MEGLLRSDWKRGGNDDGDDAESQSFPPINDNTKVGVGGSRAAADGYGSDRVSPACSTSPIYYGTRSTSSYQNAARRPGPKSSGVVFPGDVDGMQLVAIEEDRCLVEPNDDEDDDEDDGYVHSPPRGIASSSWKALPAFSTKFGLSAATAAALFVLLVASNSRTRILPNNRSADDGTTDTAAAVASTLLSSALPPPYITKGISTLPPLRMTYPSDPLPFSIQTPTELGLDTHYRSSDSRPGEVFGAWRHESDLDEKLASTKSKFAMPTNMWYENLLLGSISSGHVTPNNRAYTIPYIVDFAGPIPGIRVQFPHVVSGDTIVQMATVPRHGLTLGTLGTTKGERGGKGDGRGGVDQAYVVDEGSVPRQLGLGLRWSERGCDGSGLGSGGDGDSHGEKRREEENNVCPTMKTRVLRGIPYVTMEYTHGMVPVISAEVPVAGSPIIDSHEHDDERGDGDATPRSMECGVMGDDEPGEMTGTPVADVVRVEGEVSLTFKESDFTWLVFFSRPVRVSCYRKARDVTAPPLPPGVVDFSVNSVFELRVVEDEEEQEHDDIDPWPRQQHPPLIVRAALANNCTSGSNPLYCVGGEPRAQNHLGNLLRKHADMYPSQPEIRYEFPSTTLQGKEGGGYALIHFDWKPRSMREDTTTADAMDVVATGMKSNPSSRTGPKLSKELLMYALPHHTDSIESIVGSTNGETGYCSDGLHGRACLLRGGEWVMREDLDGPPSFVATRPPHHNVIASLADAISDDIHYELPEYYMAGAGDTYFSGKMLAKLGRIIVIASELKGLAATPEGDTFESDDPSERELERIVEKCRKATLPSDATMAAAIARLRSGVEVWLNGTAQAKFLYDDDWGGMVNCGCLFNSDTQRCDNTFPDCPSFTDPGLNFGNGFYNDHHFHYGYMISAAAVVANFDLSWGRKYFQRVLLLVRDIANPSVHDRYFPAFRHKDWFLGSSWASGIATLGGQPYLNGRNQESSSEAIHAYEAIALYGAVMVRAWGDGVSSDVSENDNAKTASRVRDMGRLLTATEIRSAQRYWHVLHGDSAINTVYPKSYKPAVVGMMWDTMCQFQTWFGSAPYLAYGIQLMPLTSVSERRDAVNWAQQMYSPFAESCVGDINCEAQGWSVLQYAMLSVVGHRDLAAKKANDLPASVFTSAGGNGHSRTNTLWYIGTRPDVAEPLILDHATSKSQAGDEEQPEEHLQPQLLNCGCPETCTESQWEADAGGYTCESRIRWLMSAFGKTEVAACRQVGGNEFAVDCGGCDPDRCIPPVTPTPVSVKQIELDNICPPCSSAVCKGEINRCPRSLLAPFLCLSGASRGGCSQTPWIGASGNSEFCSECCRLTERCFGL